MDYWKVILILCTHIFSKLLYLNSEITYMDCLLVACIRKLQNWSFTSIIGEFRLFSGTKRHFDLEQLIEMFDHSYIKLDTTKCSTSKIPKFLVSDIQLRVSLLSYLFYFICFTLFVLLYCDMGYNDASFRNKKINGYCKTRNKKLVILFWKL
jgi:hypothetical protein